MTYSPTSTLRFAMLSGMVKPSMVGSKGLKSSRAIYTCTRYQASITPKPKSPASSLLVSKRTPKQYDHSRNSIRLVSTASTSPNPTPDSSSSVSASNLKYASPTSTDLTWARFLRLRRTRRLYNLAASTSTGLLSCYIGINYLVMQDIDKLASQFGLDPVIMMGIATAGFGAAGILVGPMVGSGIFGLVHRGAGRGFAAVSYSKHVYRSGKQGTHAKRLIRRKRTFTTASSGTGRIRQVKA